MYTVIMAKTIIRFVAINRKTRETRPCWVSGASFADGPGFRVKSVRTTFNRDEAAAFETSTAFAIAEQYCNTPAVLETRKGELLVDDTQRLLAEQRRRFEANVQMRQQFRNDLNSVFADMSAAMKASFEKVLCS